MYKNLVFGYINTNVLDGSAIFMSSLCNVLSKNNSSNTDLLLAVPFKRNTVLTDLNKLDNVSIIDPFVNSKFQNFDLTLREQISITEAAELIIYSDELYDYNKIFIRSLEVTEKLIEIKPSIVKKIYSYITGVTSSKQILSEKTKNLFLKVERLDGKFLSQTNEMKNHIINQVKVSTDTIIDLNPMIPDIPFSHEDIFRKKNTYNKFVYSGKFASEWNTIPMLTQFRELCEDFSAELYLAGDQFKTNNNDVNFTSYAKYLIENTKNTRWFGGLNRNQSLSLINSCDIGLTWRDEALNDSLELSTKLLEYCMLGKPPILNKTDMHVKIFGENYPFFCENDKSFLATLKFAIENPEIVEKYSKVVYQIAQEYTFNSVAKKLADKLDENINEYTFLMNENVEVDDYFERYDQNEKVNKFLESGKVSDKEYERIRTYANQANEKYKLTMEKLKKTKEFADLANNKYKETMEKHKKAVDDYNKVKEENKKLKKRIQNM